MTAIQDNPPYRRATIVCLHASGGTGAQWTTLAEKMRPDFRVLTPDLYGHGTAPPWHGTPADIVAADTQRIGQLVAQMAGDVHLVGHSYGAAIALRVALDLPRAVVSVAVYEPVAMRTLFDYNAKHRAASEIAEVADDIRRALIAEWPERAARRFVDFWSGADQWVRLAPAQQTAIARRMPVIEAHFRSLRHDVVRLRDYARLAMPVLCLTGRDTRASARRMAELLGYALPEVALLRLDGMGHLGPITHPDSIARIIADFVRARASARIGFERRAA